MEANKINVWYITGCTNGVGLSLVEKILENPNNRVTGTSRDIKKIESLSVYKNPNFLGVQVEIGNEESIKESVEKTIKKFGDLTHVVNNAGYAVVGAIEEGLEKDYQDLFECLYFYPLRVIRSVLPHMRSKKNGYIFNIGSIAGVSGHPRYGAYAGAKSAMMATTQSLASDVKPFNIKVSYLILGHFMTNFQKHVMSDEALVSGLIADYDTKSFWNKMVTPYMKILTQGDIKKLANLIVNHYANQPELPYNLIIGPKETFIGVDRKISDLQAQVASQREFNSDVILVKENN
ncbi:hypothetical protein DICPUDRAFT_88868 [Dictyostelium purpureum]|uniref:NAD(P)-binding protein n=1 Tax=Dictyostelium purpureum TaxID=5786 RepID=F0ZS50_DICPU|nr:uncharacterized protein DICPUDRAFT_88868 [Dictyostelium purpureum]EGC33251.1 hypothetical protein DICPUDRAFT_88868 [Dictyostelium purpureum]|eukprot:XP_003290244.1 hypothetical protein DICPUDRAFT_88868 [Dictyostelium purpureum]